MQKLLLFFHLLWVNGVAAQNTVTISLKDVPGSLLSKDTLFVAGSFNGWNPRDKNFAFMDVGNGHYMLDLKLGNGNYEYKITRGSWQTSECSTEGAPIQNRILRLTGNASITITVAGWQDYFVKTIRQHTRSKQVVLLDSSFFMPQLQRYRRIWVYLPQNYSAKRCKRYPVLYMHDGQNVFDAYTAYAAEWGVDEFMDTTSLRKSIVVAIDHGESRRMNEYNPYDSKKFGEGEGDRYADFLVETLKPYVDKHFRTKRQKKYTFIAGSSMGGLISTYTALKYPQTYGAAGLFSPAYWTTNDSIFTAIQQRGGTLSSNLYFYMGQLEGDLMATDMFKAVDYFLKGSPSRIESVFRADGAHNENTWRREFPAFYEFIMARGVKRK